jgi:multidrug efflux pump subunit AcrB
VADALEFFIDGVTTTGYHEGNVQIPIVGRGVKSERESAESLTTVSIRTENGGNVLLNQAGLPALASKIGLDNQICIR